MKHLTAFNVKEFYRNFGAFENLATQTYLTSLVVSVKTFLENRSFLQRGYLYIAKSFAISSLTQRKKVD